MELARPARMSVVLVAAKSVDDDTGIAGLLEGAEQCGLGVGLFATERKVPVRRQALEQNHHERGRVLANARRSVRVDYMAVPPPLGECRPRELGHGLHNVHNSAKAPASQA